MHAEAKLRLIDLQIDRLNKLRKHVTQKKAKDVESSTIPDCTAEEQAWLDSLDVVAAAQMTAADFRDDYIACLGQM